MKKWLVAYLFPLLLTPVTTISSEHQLELSPEEQFYLTYAGDSQGIYHSQIPANPRLYQDSLTYRDKELTDLADLQSADKPLPIAQLHINNQSQPVFELADGRFMEASQLLVFDDGVMAEQELDSTFWLGETVTVYDSPVVFGTKTVKTDLKPFQAIQVTKQAQTHSGTYYYVDKKGWLAEEALYRVDQRMDLVQQLLASKYSDKKYAIYVEDLTDGQIAQVNADKVMYGASIAKLAIIYQAQLQLADGSIQLTDKVKYSPETNTYQGAYDTAGAGGISKTADNKDYTIEELLKALIQSSDNAASNILGYYLTDKNSQNFQDSLTALLGSDWDMVDRNLSAQLAAQLMKAIYHQGGPVLDYMTDTEFDNSRIPRDIEAKVAHKTGDAYDFRHDVAVVYADRPFVLSIFTDGASHEDLSKIAKDIYQLLK